MKAILGVILLALVAGAVPMAFAWRSALEPVDPPPPASFDRASIMRGAQLALIGNCNVCHTAASGPAYAGQRPVHTAFGTIYATNITPDPETGIGRWSEAAFTRAMRESVDRRGRHLYPAFPYDHFTRASDEDLKSLYAFLMTREPVRAETPANQLPFPLNLRPLIAAWKWLFFEPSRFEPDPAQSADLTRGAYLVRSLGHCGACHTPRNVLGAEKKTQILSGGEAEGWHAPALNAASPSPRAWTADSLYRYLRHGLVEQRGIPAGPMAPVVHNLAAAADDDVRAIASYIASLMPAVRPERERSIDVLIASIQRPEPGATRVAQSGTDPQSLRQGELLY
ncbi:MAG: cytochrome c, partial [Betaproteobacteria bacterium]|nr:cytochrome c [Betaproteobacteria bacterium]